MMTALNACGRLDSVRFRKTNRERSDYWIWRWRERVAGHQNQRTCQGLSRRAGPVSVCDAGLYVPRLIGSATGGDGYGLPS